MSDTTLETPHTLAPADRRSAAAADPGDRARSLLRRYVWWLVALLIIGISVALLAWAGTRPGYDPYGWLIWGHQTWRGSLNLGGAPSWKPFSYIPNVFYALFGHFALHLWMVTSVAVSLAGAVFGGRIAYRLTAREGASWWQPVIAAIVAGACVLGIQDGSLALPGSMSIFHYTLSAQSDPMIVTVCLAAIDMFLIGRFGWAFWLAVYAGLGRPEVWVYLAIYGLWIIKKKPDMRWMVVAGAAVTLFFWFGIPEITNGKPDIAGQLAMKSPRELHSNKIVGTLARFYHLLYLPIEIAAAIAVVLAFVRRNKLVLAIAGTAVIWVITEVAFVLHGFPGVQRYLFEPAGVTGVLAGIATGWLLIEASHWHPRLPRWAGIPVAVAFIAVCIPHAKLLAGREHRDIVGQRNRTWRIQQLGAAIHQLGVKRIESCGGPLLNVEYVSATGWYMGLNTGQIAYQPLKVLKRTNPVIFFITLPNGWAINPLRPQNAKVSGCASLKSLYVPTAYHPRGVLIYK